MEIKTVNTCNSIGPTAAQAGCPLVSVIIPTYNRKELLVEAIESCFSQTWRAIEVIVIDDGSTDKTGEFMQAQLQGRWAKKGIQYHSQNNSGASSARNFGLSIARGVYVQFLDSDDILCKEKIELQAKVLESQAGRKADGCSCFGRAGDLSDPRASRSIGVHCRNAQEYVRVLTSRVVHGMQTSAPLWRRSFLTNGPGWRTDIDLGDDLEYYIRLLAGMPQIEFVEKELFWVRDHPGSRLSDAEKNRARTLSAIRARRAIFETLQSSKMWDTQVQKNFLEAMRTIYANLLNCGSEEDIINLENWILQCARFPSHQWRYSLIIALRRTFGKRALLSTHNLIKNIQGMGRGENI